MREKLELVTSFGSLRAGMIVVVKPCKVCNVGHRGVLTQRNTNGWTDVDGNVYVGSAPCWRFLPRPACSGEHHAIFTEAAVHLGKVWRVVDGLEDTTTEATTATRPRQRERAR